MPWRETILRRLGPGMLGGITFGDWIRLLRENDFEVDPRQLVRVLSITSQSVQNSLCRRLEQWRYGSCAQEVDVPPPLFILGHWRSGTTHLHNLLTVDERFGFANNYQTLFPHAFLSMESLHSPFLNWFLPKRRPMDSMTWTMSSPQEDEFAVCVTTFKSPCMGWFFPNRWDAYNRYLTLREASGQEVEEWKAALMTFLKRLTWKLKRPLALKSPAHTCRIKLLLDLFPEAKFVHIHRNPYAVFRSTRNMLIENFKLHCLQRPSLNDLDERILRQYRTMYDVFFEERNLIPPGHYHEVCFEELEMNPIGQVERIYEALGLPEFGETRQALADYVRSIDGYKKNEFPEMEGEVRARVAQEWRFCFERWGYPAELGNGGDPH